MYLTVKEMAAQLKLSEKTVRRRVWSGEIPSVKIGAAVRVAKDDFYAYLARNVRQKEAT